MADGSIKISIEVDGKQVDVAAKQLDNLEASGGKSGRGVKSAEDSLNSLSDASGKAGSNVKGAGDSIEGLGDSGSKAGQGLKGAEGAIDGVADSSAQASSAVQGAGDTIEGLGSSGDSASQGLQGVDGALDGVADSSAQASDSVRNTSDAMADVDGKTNQASVSIKTFAASIGLVAIAAKAFDAMRSSMDQAIGRFDTLNAFPKVLQALGVSAEDSEAAMAKLSDGIDGLPTKLNDIASTAQSMYTSFGDMDKATDTALALNNALLGSGASADAAKRGTDQYIKALQTGTINMDTWNTLSETMDVGLVKIAEGFGFAGASAKDDLYNALQDGTHTFDEFNDKLIEVGTGTGIMAELARENSLGLATSFGNLRNAIANGVAKIIEAFNNLSIAVTGKDIAQNVDSMKVVVNAAFNLMKSTIEATTPVFKFFGDAVGIALTVIKPLTPAILGMVAAFTGLMVVKSVMGVMNGISASLAAAELSTKALTLATNKQMAATIADTALTKKATIAKAADLGMINLSTLAIGVMTGRIKLAAAATIAWAAAKKLLLGPIGIATIAIGGLVGATIGLVKWFKSSSEESERLKEEVEQMGEETDSLTQSVDSNSQAYKDQVSNINANQSANNELLDTVDELSQKENKSEGDKQKLKAAVDQLNGSVDGLNLMYNEEADRLSESSDQIQARIDLMSDLESGQAAQERYTEILQDQAKVEEQLEDVLNQKKEAQENSNLTNGEAKDITADLTEQEEQLRAKLEELGNQKKTTEEQMTAAQDAIKQAVEDGNAAMILSYDVLDDAQQDAFERMKDRYEDLRDAATNAFEKISDESEVSAQEMIDNLEHNQEMVAAWGENHGKLMEYASKNGHEGFMQWLDTLGIDSAAELQTVADMSEEQLAEFAGLMDEGGNTAATAMKDSLGEGLGEVGDILVSMVDDGAMTTAEAIEAANFYELFGVLPDDAASGIEEGTPEVEAKAEQVVTAAYNAISNAFGTLGFKEQGSGAVTGVASGINEGIPSATIAGGNLAMEVFNKVSSNMAPSQYSGTGSNVGQGTGTGIDGSSGAATGAAARLTSSVTSETESGLPKSTFEGYGRNVGQGLSSGILSMMDTVTSAVRSVTSGASLAATSALDINSPSRLFFGYGQFVSQGLGNGISDGQSGVINSILSMTTAMINRTNTGMQTMNSTTQAGINSVSLSIARLPGLAQTSMTAFSGRLRAGASVNQGIMSRLSSNMTSPFGSLRGRLSGIGSNAIGGLQAGLNGGVGRVMSTARNIASRVASTMKSALKIHSPSRVMEDDVGMQVPAGVAVGIEKNANLVYRALDDLASGMIKPVSPEVALGTSSMAYNGADSISQAVKNIRIPENKPDGSVAGLLRESNDILRSLLNKDTNTYLDSEKLTKAVNENNAILASLSAF